MFISGESSLSRRLRMRHCRVANQLPAIAAGAGLLLSAAVSGAADTGLAAGGDRSVERAAGGCGGGQAAVHGKMRGLSRDRGISAGEPVGPNLATVYGRKRGTLDGFAYSAAMSASTGVWDVTSLNLFIADPSRYVPGTKRSAPPVIDPRMRRQIIAFLQQQSGKRP